MLTVAGSIESRSARGGTARVSVEQQMREMFDEIERISEWLLERTPPPPDNVESEFEWWSDPPPA